MALDESELPPLETEQDALDRIDTVLEGVREGRLEIAAAKQAVLATSIWWHLRRSDTDLLTQKVRRAATELRGELEDERHDDDEPWKQGG